MVLNAYLFRGGGGGGGFNCTPGCTAKKKVLPFGLSRQERIQRVEIVFTINFDHTVSPPHAYPHINLGKIFPIHSDIRLRFCDPSDRLNPPLMI